jgi:FkbM family methyltransferase
MRPVSARRTLGALYDRLPLRRRWLSPLRPLGLPHRLYQHLHFEGVFEVATRGRPFRMVHHGDEIENECFWEGLPGRRERGSMTLWMELAERAKTIVDVGAHVGVYSLAAAAVSPAARVHGFEPLAELFARYERNCELNRFDVHCHRVALSDAIGVGVMKGWVLEKGPAEPGPDEELVRTSRLDAMLEAAEVGSIDLVKLDVEGHEPEILAGMGRYLTECRPSLLMEVLTDGAGARAEAVLDGLAYLYFDLDDVSVPRRRSHIGASSHWNYLICQPEVAARLGLL